MNVALLNALNLNLKPTPPYSNVQGGRMRVPIFSGKGVFFWPFVLGRYSREKLEKRGGGGFKPISRDMGCFSEASRKIKKKGV